MKGSCRLRTFFKSSAERIMKEYIKAAPPSLPPPEAEKARAEFIDSKKVLLKEAETVSLPGIPVEPVVKIHYFLSTPKNWKDGL